MDRRQKGPPHQLFGSTRRLARTRERARFYSHTLQAQEGSLRQLEVWKRARGKHFVGLAVQLLLYQMYEKRP